MRIALVAPLHELVPPPKYGGTERIVAYLAAGLVSNGHDVTVFAARGSHTPATLVESYPGPMRELGPTFGEEEAPYTAQLRQVLATTPPFDIIHIHHGTYPFQRAVLTAPGPYVWTDHYLPNRGDQPAQWAAYARDLDAGFIAISATQRSWVPGARWLGTVLHGLPRELLRPVGVPDAGAAGYLAWMGRLSPEKGAHEAAHIAAAAGAQLRVAAKPEGSAELQRYWAEELAPLFAATGAVSVGEIGDGEKSGFLSGAAALLVPSLWEEPFGLILIEAAACGTPVIVYDRGAARELVEEGVTGFVVRSREEAVAAVPKARVLDRRRIREVFEERFTAERMTREHEEIYARVMKRRAAAAAAAAGEGRKVEEGFVHVEKVD